MRTTIAFALTAGLVATSAQAAYRNVPSALYPTIGAAIAASGPGDLINIGYGVYTENLSITVNSLTIQGSCYNPGNVIVDGTNDDVFTVNATNVTIKCLTVRNGDKGIQADLATGIQLQSLKVLSSAEEGIYLNDANNFRIQAVEVRGAEGQGIYVDGGDNGMINSTTVRNVSSDCIAVENSNRVVVTGNTLLQCGSYGEDEYFYQGAGVIMDGDDHTVSFNSITSTFDPGIDLVGNRATILRNTLTNAAQTNDSISLIGDDGTIDYNRASVCYYDCIGVTGARTKIRNNTLQAFDDYCVDLQGADGLLTDNTCSNSAYGYYLSDGDRNRIERNVADRVGDTSYEIYGDDLKVLNNRATDCGFYDSFYIECTDCDATEVRGNEAARQALSDNQSAGFYLELGGPGAVVTNNQAIDGSGWGFYLSGNSCTMTNNTAVGNGNSTEAGFHVDGNSNTLSHNQARENQGPGFLIDGDDNILLSNFAVRNMQEGIYIESGSDNRLSQNTVNSNSAEGIDNDGTDTDFFSNVSSFNRRDCTNDGSFDQRVGNNCFDGSNFNETSVVDN